MREKGNFYRDAKGAYRKPSRQRGKKLPINDRHDNPVGVVFVGIVPIRHVDAVVARIDVLQQGEIPGIHAVGGIASRDVSRSGQAALLDAAEIVGLGIAHAGFGFKLFDELFR